MQDIILDVDTGIDDAMALILAGRLVNDFRLVGVTTVAGNVDLVTATENTRAVLGLLGRTDVGVAAGAAGPLVRELRTATTFHGPRGLGLLDARTFTVPWAPLRDECAAELIIRSARERPGQLTVIALGPLTNVALAFKADPGLPSRLKSLVIMGGAIATAGNASPVAEANFLNDPEAAQIVLAAGVPTTLVPLDVTEQVIVTRPRLEALRVKAQKQPAGIANFAVEILDFYLNASQQFGREGCSLHDPLAVLIAARPELVETANLNVQVATNDPLTAGSCVVDRRPRTTHRPTLPANVHSCVRVRVDAGREQILASFFPANEASI